MDTLNGEKLVALIQGLEAQGYKFHLDLHPSDTRGLREVAAGGKTLGRLVTTGTVTVTNKRFND